MLEVSRRKFFQGAALLGASAALVGCAPKSMEEGEKTEESAAEPVVETKYAWCKMCGPARTHCATVCTIKDGRWVHVEGNPEAGNNYGRGSKTLCAKGNSAMHTVYTPTRLQYPMKRTGEKGEGKFEQITWEQAIEEIAAKLKEQAEQYGPESLGILSPQYFAVLGSLGRRFLNVHGSPNYLHSAICNSQRMFSRLVTLGGPNHFACGNPQSGQQGKSSLIVNWGFNSENSAINQGDPCDRLDCQENGCKVIDIRPMQEGLGSHADIWLGVVPGTDAALSFAILNYIIVNDLYDHEFVENWRTGFEELAEHMKQFTTAWAADLTGIEEARIIEVAELMGTTKPMSINVGNGIGDQSDDAHWTVATICLISAITGNLLIPGGGGAPMVPPKNLIPYNEIDLLSDRLPASDEDKENGWMAGVSKLVAPETPRWFQTMETQESGPTSAYNKALQAIISGKPYPLRCVIGQSSNPLSATRQPKTIVEALKKLDYYVVMDTAWNSSCDYADIVLPAATQYEVSEQFDTKNSADGTYIGINQVVSEAPGECRGDWQFYLDLAVAMGYGEDFWNGDIDAMLREQLDDSGIDLDELREKGYIFVERTDGSTATEPEYQTYEKLFSTLPEGKVQCYNSWIGGKPNADDTGTISPLPEFKGAPESKNKTPKPLEEYPLVFSDVHAYRLCNHSYYHDVPYLREKQPEPWVKINPATAAEYGIEDGDWVKITSIHGHVKMVARLFEAIAPNVLMSKRGWWEPCEELDLPGYGCLDGGSEVNVLYNDDMSNYDSFNSAMSKQTLVKIEKIER